MEREAGKPKEHPRPHGHSRINVMHLHQPLAGAQRVAHGAARRCGRALGTRAPVCEACTSIFDDDARPRVATGRANRRRRGLDHAEPGRARGSTKGRPKRAGEQLAGRVRARPSLRRRTCFARRTKNPRRGGGNDPDGIRRTASTTVEDVAFQEGGAKSGALSGNPTPTAPPMPVIAPELALLVAAWPNLPQPVRDCILSLVRTAAIHKEHP